MFSSKNNDSWVVGIGAVLVLLIGGVVFQQFWKSSASLDDSQQSLAGSSQEDEESIPTISPEVVRQKILNNEKIRFLDFRDPESFQQEHIPHSLSLSPALFDTFNPEKDELLVGILSSKDTQAIKTLKNVLRRKSFEVFLLSGGFEAWKNSGNRTISFGDPTSILDQSKVTYITQEEIQNSDLDFIMLDVQSTENYQRKHIAGALHIPLDQLEKRYMEIPGNENIVVYGENEVVSFQGAVRLSGLDIITSKALRGNTHLDPESIFLLEP